MRLSSYLPFMLTVAGLVGGPQAALAQDKDKKPKTYTVKQEPLRKVVKLKGVFEAAQMRELSLELRQWASVTVLDAVPHGKAVKKGERLVRLEMDKIEEAIRDAQVSADLAEVSYQQARNDIQFLDKTTPLDLEAAKRAKKFADEDLDRFLKIDRPQSEKSAEFSVKSSKNYLAYEQEELRQLEQMYKADELTEESEEIILKRQRDAVERAAFNLERSRISRDRTMNITLPRQELSLKEQVRRQEISLQKTTANSELALRKARLELEKARYDLAKSARKLDRLRKDRQAMEVLAPCDGVVYYGQCVRGNWPNISAMEAKLRRGGKLSAHEVFMTVVQPRPLLIRAVVEEKDIGQLGRGLKGTAQLAGLPELRLPATIESLSPVPVAEGKFDARLAVQVPKSASRLMPGMSCTVRLVTYENPKALTVPASAVFADETEEHHYVYLVGADGKHRKQEVKGRKVGQKFEITDGLKAGDKVLRTKPEEAS